MKGDFSRDTFSPRKHYSAVLMQQGRVQLDADWNEQQAINQHRIETEARNLIGLSGGPADNAGFEISAQGGTLTIGSGDYYVDGMLCQNENPILFGGQDDLPGMDITRILSPKDEPNSVGLVYLDVWERHVTAVEDDRIREVALGGPDTTTRKRTVCQVKARRLDAADTTSNVSELQSLVREHRELANKLAVAHWRFDEDSGAKAYDSSENGNNGTLVGPTRSTGNAGGGALLFDGVDDYVATNIDAQPSAMPSTTWTTWIYPTRINHGARQAILSTDDGGHDRSVIIERGTDKFGVFTGTGVWTPVAVTPNQWQHIAVVYTPTEILFYKNGVRHRTDGEQTSQVSNNRLQIGRNPGFGEHFAGRIDEVRIYKRALDAHEIAALAAPAGELHELRTQLQRVKDRILELVKVDRHQAFDGELYDIHPPSTGELLAETNGSPSTNSSANIKPSHLLPPGAGYELLENQLYRVEIHKGGEPGVATFKWSRDNGSVVTSVLRIPYAGTGDPTSTEIAVRDLGNDETLGFAPGQYVDLVSDDRELNGQAGQILRIVDVSPAKRTITVGEKLTPVSSDDARTFHYKLRRWDCPPDQEMPPDGIKIMPNKKPIDLEGGLRVQFSAGYYNAGDYWLIPARTATGDIEWPRNEFRPPAGIRHHYSPLALAMLGTVATEDGDSEKHLLVLSDCRDLFPPLTGVTGLFYLGGDGQSALPLRELPEPLVVGVAAGGRPVHGALVKFEVQGENLATYDGHLGVDSDAATEDGDTFRSMIATTDARGEAKCFWTLARDIPNQQVKVSLADGSHLPIYFNATLSTSQTVSESIQVDKVALGEQELEVNGEIPATALADSEIRVVCSEAIDQEIIRRTPPCNLTLEIPFPQTASDKQEWGNALIGFQRLVLAADVSAQEDVFSWKPKKETSDWLKNTLFTKVPSTQIMAYFTIKGDFTFPSAGFGRSDDFEMWFRVVRDKVRLNSVTLDRAGVTGQTGSVTGTVNLVGPAIAGGVTISLASSNANVARVEPATATIPAGQTSQTFQVNTTPVATDTSVTITATFEQQVRSANLLVQAPVLESFTVNPSSLFGKATAQGTVTLTGPAPTGGVGVTLQSGSLAVVRVPQTVSVAAGNRTNANPFAIETEPVHTATPVTITASFKGFRQAQLTVQPPALSTLSLQSPSVNGGSPIPGSATVDAAAPAGFEVTLRSTDTTAATVPDRIAFNQNATTQSFTVTTRPVSSRRDISIVAARSGVERTSPLAVQPPRISTFAFSPTRIPNAGRSTGTITLTSPAPSNTVVNLVSNNDATATIPSSFPVAAGATQITFDAFGKTFTDQARSVTVQAIYLGTTQSASLTVDAGKAKEKEKEKEKEKDIKELPEKIRLLAGEKEFEKIQAEKNFDDIRIQPRNFAEMSRAEEIESAPEGSGSERSFIQPEERPESGTQTPDGSEEQ